MVICNVCSKNENACYKCPTCRIPYCTLACFKVHKESNCEKLASCSAENTSGTSTDVKYSYVTEDTLPFDRLKQLENNEELRQILSDKRIRDMLVSVDACKDPSAQIEHSMKDPGFEAFVDTCLRSIEDKN